MVGGWCGRGGRGRGGGGGRTGSIISERPLRSDSLKSSELDYLLLRLTTEPCPLPTEPSSEEFLNLM
jgi:hypothetical protein